MALPASAPINMQQIQDEFLAPRGTGLTSFYRGGSFVANTAGNSGVPTSGAINLLNFLGASRVGALAVVAGDTSGSSYPGANFIFASASGTPSGGVPPYSYAWTFISGSSFTIDSPSSQGTNFRRPGNPPQGNSASGVYRITVTDSAITTAFKDITVTDTRV